MPSKTGSYIAAHRQSKRLTPQQVAAAAGFKNLASGGNRILALEREGVTPVPELLDHIVAILELDRDHVHALVAEDRRDLHDAHERWISEPVAPELRRRLMPAIWQRVQMPHSLSWAEAVEFAKTGAVDEKRTFVLMWSRRLELWCYPTGEVYERHKNVGDVVGPVARLRGRGGRGSVLGEPVKRRGRSMRYVGD